MGRKQKCNHVWSDPEIDWDKKKGKIRRRKCVVCGDVEKSDIPKVDIRRLIPVSK